MSQQPVYLETLHHIRIELGNISPQLKRQLQDRLSHIGRVTAACDAAPASDIVVQSQQQPFPPPTRHSLQMAQIFGYYVHHVDAVSSVFLFHQAQICAQVCLGSQIRVNIGRRRLPVGPLYNLLIFCIRHLLAQRDQYLLHGGVYVRQQRPLILLGPRGSRKTLLGLNLLKLGWDHMAEDKFIVNHSRISQYDHHFMLNAHHFELLPWLIEQYPQARRYVRQARITNLIGKVVSLLLPDKFRIRAQHLFERALPCQVEAVFPETAQITAVDGEVDVLLLNHHSGVSQPGLVVMSRHQMIGQLVLLQRLAYAQDNQLDALIQLSRRQPAVNMSRQLDIHFPQGQFYQLNFNQAMDSGELALFINRWHNHQSGA